MRNTADGPLFRDHGESSTLAHEMITNAQPEPEAPANIRVSLPVFVDINELAPRDSPYERAYWLAKFGLTPQELIGTDNLVKFTGSPGDLAKIGLMTSVNGKLEAHIAYCADVTRSGRPIEYVKGVRCPVRVAPVVKLVLRDIVVKTGKLPWDDIESSVLVAKVRELETEPK